MSSIIRATTTSGLQVAPDNSGSLELQTNGTTTAVTIDTSQNVGIGATSPATKVHAFTNSATAVAFRAGNTASYAEFQVDASGNSQLIAPNGVQIFNTNGAERMRIDSSGNVGIGVTPSAWVGGFKPLQLASSAIAGYDDGVGNIQTEINTNLYQSSLGTYTYIKSYAAVQYRQINSAGHIWYTAPAGTAGASVSPTERMRIDTSGNLLFNSGYGSAATAYGCRAWVNFNGTGTIAIRASGGVTSLTDNGVGNYTINLSFTMPDVNFCVVGNSAGNTVGTADQTVKPYSLSTTTAAIGTTSNGALNDNVNVYVSIFR